MSGGMIVFEGLDGVGKSTLSKAVADRLGARWMCTPDATLRAVRAAIDEAMCDDPIALQLFYSATISWASTRARALIAEGHAVVMDRYWASTVAYAPLRGASIALDALEPTLLRPALTVWVDVPEALRCERLAKRGATAADNATLLQGSALRAAYARALSDPLHGAVLVVDNSGSLERSVAAVLAAIARREAA